MSYRYPSSGRGIHSVDLAIDRGRFVVVTGRIVSGKTTLLRILAGVLPPIEGSVHVAKGTQIGYLQQEAVRAFADHENTVYEEMLTAFAGLRAQEERLRQMEAQMASEEVSEEEKEKPTS